jgi:two-component system, OmpR family, sensor histidine kinase KdpD
MARATIRIYFGAAPGVGKTYAMLDEGRRRAERGTDVVIGVVDAHGRPQTARQTTGLERVATRWIEDRGVEELDVDAVLARHPDVVLVDDLAAENSLGARHAKRWQDVEELLDAGINVITTLDVTQLESLRDVVQRLVGGATGPTVPDFIVRRADQIELVDMTPEALLRRLAHGNVYRPEQMDAFTTNLFRPQSLATLRELALLWVADRVEETLQQHAAVDGTGEEWTARERVLVALTGAPGGDRLIRRASRIARRARGELLGVHITTGDRLTDATDDNLRSHRELLIELGGTYHEVASHDVARGLVEFAHAERATQLVVGASPRSRLTELWRSSIVADIVRADSGLDVHVISRGVTELGQALPAVRRRAVLSRQRRLSSWLVAAVGLPLVTIVCTNLRDHVGSTTPLLLYLLITAAVAGLGGALAGVATAIVAFGLDNWFFTAPVHRWTVSESEDVVALVVFVAVASLIAALVGAASRRRDEATRARAEAAALARSTGTLVGDSDPLPKLVEQIRTTFGLDAVAVLSEAGEGAWTVEASAGAPVPARPDDGAALGLAEGGVVVLVGPALGADDVRLLASFNAQVGSALSARRLHAEADRAKLLAEANALRAAMLQSVSHDLRTPLASIKASVTGLMQHDVAWSKADADEFLEMIDTETDRLNGLIGNLLDMSRLQSGALHARLVPTDAQDVVAGALASLSRKSDAIEIDIPDELPPMLADPVLLERALANLISNAVGWAPADSTVRVRGTHAPGSVALRVIDTGPGIPVADRARVLEPFQRLGDRSNEAGVGLGLAVAHGFVGAMGGTLELDDTPGGGLTAVVTLPEVER